MNVYFKTFNPSGKLRNYIKNYWIIKGDAAQYFETIATSGCTRIIFNRASLNNINDHANAQCLKKLYDKKEKFSTFHHQGTKMGNCIIIGPRINYLISTYKGNIDTIGVEFTYLGTKRFFNSPAQLFRNKICSPIDIDDNELDSFQKKLQISNNIKKSLDNFFEKRLLIIDYQNNLEFYTIKALNNYKATKVNDLVNFTWLQARQTQRYFSHFIGVKPSEFIAIQRLKKSISLMITKPQISIKDIANSCGFCNNSYFNAAFSRFCGHTPAIVKNEIEKNIKHKIVIRKDFQTISFCVWM